jgi:hypothetical protein
MKIEVSNGEIIDKLSILKIKLDNIKDEDKLKNIRKEHDILNGVLPIIKQNCSPIEFEILFNQLIGINKKLWDIEDRIREKESLSEFDDEFIQIARSVYKFNDFRSKVKKEINILTKSNLIEEKSYK